MLTIAASYGNVETFELLRAKGAPLDPSPLNRAVEQATRAAPQEGCEPRLTYLNMLRHLVDVVKLDVNAVQQQLGRPCHTPLCIAAGGDTTNYKQDFRPLIAFLLDRGADPFAPGGSWGSAMDCAQAHNNMHFLQAVERQQAEKQAEKQAKKQAEKQGGEGQSYEPSFTGLDFDG